MNMEVIEINLNQLLTQRGKSLNWLSKETGLNYVTLWKLRKNETNSIEFRVAEKICTVLNCGIEELLVIVPEKKSGSKKGG